MPPPPFVVDWVKKNYSKPQVDPVWLNDCYEYIVEQHNLNPASQAAEIVNKIEFELLHSDLADSMVPGTGLPQNIGGDDSHSQIRGPVLVEITAMDEHGVTAFELMQIRQARIDHQALYGLNDTQEQDEDQEEIGPIPQYPHRSLSFDLFDGTQLLRALEFDKISELDLAETPLGLKLILINVEVKRGIAFLKPTNIRIKGGLTQTRNDNKDADFLRGLRRRLGLPVNDPPPPDAAQSDTPPPSPPPPSPPAVRPPVVHAPLRKLVDRSGVPGPSRTRNEDENLPPRRKIPPRPVVSLSPSSSPPPPLRPSPSPPQQPPSPPLPPPKLTQSHYFGASGLNTTGSSFITRDKGKQRAISTIPKPKPKPVLSKSDSIELARGFRLATPTAPIDDDDFVGLLGAGTDEDEDEDDQHARTGGFSNTGGQSKSLPAFRGVKGSRKGKERDLGGEIRVRYDSDVEMELNPTIPSLARTTRRTGKRKANEEVDEGESTRGIDDDDDDDGSGEGDNPDIEEPPEPLVVDVDESDSYYGDEFEYGEDFFREIDEAERKPLGLFGSKGHTSKSQLFPTRQRGIISKQESDPDTDFDEPVGRRKRRADTQDTNQTLVGTSSMRAATHTQATLVTASARRETQQMPLGTVAQPIDVDMIEISDDEKENVPVPTRRVRRRVNITSDATIIDLSSD